MAALDNWFVFISEDINSTDTARVADLTTVGNSLIAAASTQLEMLTLTVAPAVPVGDADPTAYNRWQMVIAMMAAELYTRTGKLGLTQAQSQAFSGSILQGYSEIVKSAIRKLVRIGTTSRNS